MKKFNKSTYRYYWSHYCKGLTGYPSSDNSQHLSVSVRGNGKVDNVVFVMRQPESAALASNEASPTGTASKQQLAAANQPIREKKGGNIWKWCLVAAGLLTGATILGRHYWKSDKVA